MKWVPKSCSWMIHTFRIILYSPEENPRWNRFHTHKINFVFFQISRKIILSTVLKFLFKNEVNNVKESYKRERERMWLHGSVSIWVFVVAAVGVVVVVAEKCTAHTHLHIHFYSISTKTVWGDKELGSTGLGSHKHGYVNDLYHLLSFAHSGPTRIIMKILVHKLKMASLRF